MRLCRAASLLPFILSMIGLCFSLVARAERCIDVNALSHQPLALAKHFRAYEDRGAGMTLADVRALGASAFQPRRVLGDSLNFGLTDSAIWLTLNVCNSGASTRQRLIEIFYPHHDRIDFYASTPSGAIEHLTTGVYLPFKTRPYIHRMFVLPVSVAPGAEQTLWLRFKSETSMDIPARLWVPQAFESHSRVSYMAQAGYFGMLIALGLFNLLLFFAMRDSLYLLYVVFLSTAAFSIASYYGIAYEFLWPNSPYWARISTMIFFAATCVTLLVFQRRLLNTARLLPRMDKLLLLFVALNVVQAVAFAVSFKTAIRPGILLDCLSMLLALVVGVICLMRRQRSAPYFVVAFAFLLVAAALTALRGFGLLPTNFLTVNGMQLGSVLEMLLLSFALADRFTAIRLEKEKAQAEALSAQQRLVETLQTSERVLEERVHQRTSELSEANKKLRHQEDALRHAMQVAENASRLKSEFLANMSHEIRTPMNAVIGLAYLALKTELTRKQRDYISKIHRAGLSLLGVINDVLDFSKIEAGRLEMEKVEFDLDDVIANVTAVTCQAAYDKHLEYLVHIPSLVPRHLVGDSQRLGQILINLVNNAIKFTDSGEIHIGCALLEERPDTVALEFTVRDTGIGIGKEQARRLFQPFTQLDGSATRKYGGTGLGLAICKRLVNLMGGDIQVDSTIGGGSTFRFTAYFGRLHNRVPALNAIAPILQGMRIMIADSNEAAREVLIDVLAGVPMTIDTVVDGKKALHDIRKADAAQPYDIIFCDRNLPGLSGPEVATAIRDSGLIHRPRFILVTAFGHDEVRAQEAEAIDAIVCKPVNRNNLIDAILPLFDSHYDMADTVSESAPALRWDGCRVLLAEDNEINQQIAQELLQLVGFTVDIANNGKEALERLLNQAPETYQLLAMDVQMPEMDGHEVARRIREDTRFDAVPIFAFTAHALVEERQRCFAAGMQDIVPKPINPDTMFETIARWLDPPRTGEVRPAAALSENDPVRSVIALEGFETVETLRRLGGSQRLYYRLLSKMPGSIGDSVDKIRAALSSGDRYTAERVAHNVQGVLANLGAVAAAEAADILELAIRAGSETPEMVDHYERAFNAAVEQIRTHILPQA